MNDVAGLAILLATAVIPVGVARAVLKLLLSQLTRARTAQVSSKTSQPAAEPVPVTTVL
jgi:hypothetical protein